MCPMSEEEIFKTPLGRKMLLGSSHDEHRKPIDNILDQLEKCFSIVENSDEKGQLLGVFHTEFNREQARSIIHDYEDQRSLGKLG